MHSGIEKLKVGVSIMTNEFIQDIRLYVRVKIGTTCNVPLHSVNEVYIDEMSGQTWVKLQGERVIYKSDLPYEQVVSNVEQAYKLATVKFGEIV